MNSATLDAQPNRKKLQGKIAAARKQAEAAKRIAKLARTSFRAAKQRFKDAKRSAKKLRKEWKALKAELAALVATKPARKTATKPAAKRPRRARVLAAVEVPSIIEPSVTSLEPASPSETAAASPVA